ncbi:MAG: thiamine phosphate synthase [Actinomycetota bacterium]|nr:thiamine phosphate synthase [Actinomycetota bacterium]
MKLESARLYLVAPASLDAGPLENFVPELSAAGVDVIQLREKEMEAGDLIRAGEPIRDACRDAGVPFIVNDRADVALALEADGVHLGQNDLSAQVARRILGANIVGASTHTTDEIDDSLEDRPDYIAVGPVYETPTKPGRPAVGLDLIAYAAHTAAVPWFAIGGVNADTLEEVLDAGARRVVVVRAITEATDPVVAARSLRERLEQPRR